MTAHNQPSMLTMEDYAGGAVEEFAEARTFEEIHKIELDIPQDHGVVKEPHEIDAWLSIPLEFSEETGEIRRIGPRQLRVEIWSKDMPQYDAFRVGHVTRYHNDSDVAQMLYAEGVYSFNTKRVHSSTEDISEAGQARGLKGNQEQNAVLKHLAEITGRRSTTVRSAAQFVTAVSLGQGMSFTLEVGDIPVRDIAQSIMEESGKAIPQSLSDAPKISFEVMSGIPIDEHDPSITRLKLGMNDRVDGAKRITDFLFTEYNGATPIDLSHHLDVISYETLDGQAVPVNVGLDVRQITFGNHRDTEVYASTPLEARQMLDGLYKSVSQLRSYITRAQQ